MIRAAVEKDGYAVVPGVLNAQEVALNIRKLRTSTLRRSRAGMRHLMANPDVTTLASDPRLLSIASEILETEAFPFRATLFDKSAGANWLVVWHQDTALPLRSRHEAPGWGPWSVKEGIIYAHAPTQALDKVIALRLHFDDSTAQNGPLRVIPGTHKLGVLSDAEVLELSTKQSAVDCIAPQAAILAMRPLLIHSSSKSQNESPRRVLHIEYASSMSMEDGLELAIA